jgi:hypothetical protein
MWLTFFTSLLRNVGVQIAQGISESKSPLQSTTDM